MDVCSGEYKRYVADKAYRDGMCEPLTPEKIAALAAAQCKQQDSPPLATGTKFDSGKPAVDLIPPEFILELGRLYHLGAQKYAPNNWRKGIKYSRVYAAAQRHLNEFWSGTDTDPETNLSHLIHAAWNCVTLWWYNYIGQYKDYDDRYLAHRENNSIGRRDNYNPTD